MGMPKIGQTEDGHSFIGGDPSKQENWKAVGAVEDGHVFKGGDPSKAENWASVNQSMAPQTSALETGIESFGNQAAFGYLPQIQAATEPLIQGAMGLFGDNTDEKLRAQGFNIQEATPKTYLQRRDENIARQQLQASENPTTAMLSGLAGGLTSGIATGGALGALGLGGRAAGFGGRLAQAAGSGAITGAIRNPGDTSGEIAPFQPAERAQNMALDAATGAVFQGGIEGAGKIGSILKNAPKTLKSYSELKALKGSGAMLKDFRSAISKGKASKLGEAAIDEGILAIGDDIADVAQKAKAVKNEVGNNIATIYKQADELSPEGIDLKQISSSLKQNIDQKLKGMVGGTKLKERLYEVLNEIGDNGVVSMEKLREIRGSIDDNIDFAKRQTDMPKLQAELTDIRNKIQQEIKGRLDAIDLQHGTDLSNAFTKENRRYSNLSDLSKMASDKVAREEANASFGLRERMAGGVGAVVGGGVGASIGGPVGAAIGAGVGGGLNAITTKAARQYGTPFVAMTANKVAKKLIENPGSLGKFSETLIKASEVSPAEFVSAVNLMMKDPEYKKMNNGGFTRGNK